MGQQDWDTVHTMAVTPKIIYIRGGDHEIHKITGELNVVSHLNS